MFDLQYSTKLTLENMPSEEQALTKSSTTGKEIYSQIMTNVTTNSDFSPK
jgi:hypothetical protein